MKSFKRHTSKAILEYYKTTKKDWVLNQFHFYKKRNKIESDYQVWQEGFHPQLMSSIDMIDQKMQYIHLNPVRKGFVNNPEDWKLIEEISQELVSKALSYGGTATGEHGVGIGKKAYMVAEHGKSLDWMKQIKALFDPHGILNPGKIFPEI